MWSPFTFGDQESWHATLYEPHRRRMLKAILESSASTLTTLAFEIADPGPDETVRVGSVGLLLAVGAKRHQLQTRPYCRSACLPPLQPFCGTWTLCNWILGGSEASSSSRTTPAVMHFPFGGLHIRRARNIWPPHASLTL